jgi:hypothetical protein
MDTIPTTTTTKPFEVGDLVRVLEGTHDPHLPVSRLGLVVEVRDVGMGSSDIYSVRFGSYILAFHKMWLERVT